MPFKMNDISLELIRDHQPVRNLVRKACLPAAEPFRGRVLTHDFHDIGRCDGSGIWESLLNSARSEPMVSMTVGNVDGCQVLTLCCNPICKSIGLLNRHKGIHEDSIP